MSRKISKKYNIFPRLEIIRKRLGLNQKEFCEKIQILPPAYIKFKKGTMPSYPLVVEVIEMFNLNANWLLTGEGPMFLGEEGQESEPEAPQNSVQEVELLRRNEQLVDKLLKSMDKIEGLEKKIEQMAGKTVLDNDLIAENKRLKEELEEYHEAEPSEEEIKMAEIENKAIDMQVEEMYEEKMAQVLKEKNQKKSS